MTAGVKWLYIVGISEPQRNKRTNNGQGKYKLNEQPLKTRGARKVTSG